MVQAMTDLALTMVRLGMRLAMVSMMISAFVLIYNLARSVWSVTYSNSLFEEIMTMVQIWLPFDLGMIFGWLVNAGSLVLMYYLYVYAVKVINSVAGTN